MNIGIVTIQGFNTGSFLQGFALKTYLEKMGHNVYFINTMRLKQLLSSLTSLEVMFEIKKNFIFISAWKNQASKNRRHKFDIIVIGSDIVWAKNRPLNYGYGLNGNRIISYAACCGGNTYENLDSNAINGLKNMDSISVRDANTARMVKKVTGNNPPIVVDPTFLINWIPFERGQITDDDYILVYSYSGKQKSLRKKAFAMNKPLISVGNYIEWCDKSIIYDESPLEFLDWIKNADCVLTDTFHGTVFSLIYKKKFAAFPQNRKTEYQLKILDIPPGKLYKNHNNIQDKILINVNQSKKYLNEEL